MPDPSPAGPEEIGEQAVMPAASGRLTVTQAVQLVTHRAPILPRAEHRKRRPQMPAQRDASEAPKPPWRGAGERSSGTMTGLKNCHVMQLSALRPVSRRRGIDNDKR